MTEHENENKLHEKPKQVAACEAFLADVWMSDSSELSKPLRFMVHTINPGVYPTHRYPVLEGSEEPVSTSRYGDSRHLAKPQAAGVCTRARPRRGFAIIPPTYNPLPWQMDTV